MAELSTLARPYAKAAFEFAVDARIFKVGLIVWLLSAAVTQHAAVVKLLTLAKLNAERSKRQTIIDLCGDDLDAQLDRNFIAILSENQTVTLLPQISHQFEIMKANREKAVDVDVGSAAVGCDSSRRCYRCTESKVTT